MKRLYRFGLLPVFALMLTPALAEEATELTGENRTRIEITVYNQNLGLVKDLRKLKLNQGLTLVSFRDVAAQVDPTSVHFKSTTAPEGVVIREQNYQYDLVSSEKLLEKYIDKEIELIRRDENGLEVERLSGTLLSAQGGQASIVQIGGKLYLNPRAEVVLPELPAGLITRPTLMWEVEAPRAAKHLIEVSYLTSGINWHAEYVAVVNRSHDRLDLTGWVTLENKSGATYPRAKLKLVAGDVHRLTQPRAQRERGVFMAAETAAPQFEEKEFFEYHLYALDRKATVADNETKQLSLLNASDVPVEKVFVFDPNQMVYPTSRGEGVKKGKIKVMLDLENKKEHNLGMALPKGKVRVYQADDEDSLQFVGEDEIDHTPRDEEIRLYTGNAFDLVGERKQTAHRKIADDVSEESFEIRLSNHKDEDVRVVAVEHLYGDWEILDQSHKHEKKDAETIEFNVPVAADSETTVTYTVRITQ